MTELSCAGHTVRNAEPCVHLHTVCTACMQSGRGHEQRTRNVTMSLCNNLHRCQSTAHTICVSLSCHTVHCYGGKKKPKNGTGLVQRVTVHFIHYQPTLSRRSRKEAANSERIAKCVNLSGCILSSLHCWDFVLCQV